MTEEKETETKEIFIPDFTKIDKDAVISAKSNFIYKLVPANANPEISNEDIEKIEEYSNKFLYEMRLKPEREDVFKEFLESKPEIQKEIKYVIRIPHHNDSVILVCTAEIKIHDIKRKLKTRNVDPSKILPYLINQEYFKLINDPQCSICHVEDPRYPSMLAQILDIDFEKKLAIVRVKVSQHEYDEAVASPKFKESIYYIDFKKTKPITCMMNKTFMYAQNFKIFRTQFRTLNLDTENITQEQKDEFFLNPLELYTGPQVEDDKITINAQLPNFTPNDDEIEKHDMRGLKITIVTPTINCRLEPRESNPRQGDPILYKMVSTPDNRVGVIIDVDGDFFEILLLNNKIIQIPRTTPLTIVQDDNKARDAIKRRMFPGDIVKISDGTTNNYSGQILHSYKKLIYGEFSNNTNTFRCFVDAEDAVLTHDNEGPIYNLN